MINNIQRRVVRALLVWNDIVYSVCLPADVNLMLMFFHEVFKQKYNACEILSMCKLINANQQNTCTPFMV